MSLRDAVSAALPSVLTDLNRLISIPSVSSQPEHHDDVLAAADLVAELLPRLRTLIAHGYLRG